MEERMSFFVAESPAAKQLLALVRRVAATDMILLIEGETGTGKETIARMLHYWSNRSRGPFVIFSFKGAAAAPAAEIPTIPFDRAAGGTLFLDEIAEASFATQSELVRFLDEVDVEAGGPAHVRDVRVVAGTSRPLKGEVDAGRFRQDLFFRLSAMPIRIPPLRERREDILVLARRYLSDVAARTGRRLSLTSDAEREMLAYRWPGNVRELRNVIERAAMLTGADFVPSKSLELGTRGDRERGERPPSEHPHPDGTPTSRTEPPTSANPPAEYAPPSSSETAAAPAPPEPEAQPSPEAVSGTLQQCLDIAARVRIKAALETAAGNRAEAAKALDIDAATLNRLIRRLGL
jgi:transcriptional regulator with GAF, ATPase, and Fis domain